MADAVDKLGVKSFSPVNKVLTIRSERKLPWLGPYQRGEKTISLAVCAGPGVLLKSGSAVLSS